MDVQGADVAGVEDQRQRDACRITARKRLLQLRGIDARGCLHPHRLTRILPPCGLLLESDPGQRISAQIDNDAANAGL